MFWQTATRLRNRVSYSILPPTPFLHIYTHMTLPDKVFVCRLSVSLFCKYDLFVTRLTTFYPRNVGGVTENSTLQRFRLKQKRDGSIFKSRTSLPFVLNLLYTNIVYDDRIEPVTLRSLLLYDRTKVIIMIFHRSNFL